MLLYPQNVTLRAIAKAAEVDGRTLRKWLREEAIRPALARRIERALAELGVVDDGQGELAPALGGPAK